MKKQNIRTLSHSGLDPESKWILNHRSTTLDTRQRGQNDNLAITLIKKYLILALVISLYLPSAVNAAKKRPPRGSQTASRPVVNIGDSRPRSSVKFRADRKGLLVNFSNYSNVGSISYSLNYTSDGVSQGAKGAIQPETAGQQREILFGTCSGGVCRWHENITEARLVIDFKLKSGVTLRKPYRIKV